MSFAAGIGCDIPHIAAVPDCIFRLSVVHGSCGIIVTAGAGGIRSTAVTEFVDVKAVSGIGRETFDIRNYSDPAGFLRETHDSFTTASRG